MRNAIDLTRGLGGENDVLWGGREGNETLKDLAAYVETNGVNPQPKSGKQEWLEALINRFS